MAVQKAAEILSGKEERLLLARNGLTSFWGQD